ncbi:unnamed protein product [Brassica rapa subsp. trilocularis]
MDKEKSLAPCGGLPPPSPSDTPPKKIGHIRACSEILTLLDDLSFDSDLWCGWYEC